MPIWKLKYYRTVLRHIYWWEKLSFHLCFRKQFSDLIDSFLREVHEEANQAREKVSELKMRRQEQVAARREKLKQAYLRKQLEKLKASKAEKTSVEGE